MINRLDQLNSCSTVQHEQILFFNSSLIIDHRVVKKWALWIPVLCLDVWIETNIKATTVVKLAMHLELANPTFSFFPFKVSLLFTFHNWISLSRYFFSFALLISTNLATRHTWFQFDWWKTTQQIALIISYPTFLKLLFLFFSFSSFFSFNLLFRVLF